MVDGRRGCVENTRFKETCRDTQIPAGWEGELARYLCTSDCRECCKVNSSLEFDLTVFQGECYSQKSVLGTKRTMETTK